MGSRVLGTIAAVAAVYYLGWDPVFLRAPLRPIAITAGAITFATDLLAREQPVVLARLECADDLTLFSDRRLVIEDGWIWDTTLSTADVREFQATESLFGASIAIVLSDGSTESVGFRAGDGFESRFADFARSLHSLERHFGRGVVAGYRAFDWQYFITNLTFVSLLCVGLSIGFFGVRDAVLAARHLPVAPETRYVCREDQSDSDPMTLAQIRRLIQLGVMDPKACRVRTVGHHHWFPVRKLLDTASAGGRARNSA